MKEHQYVQVIAVIIGVVVIALFFGIMPQLSIFSKINESIALPGYQKVPPPVPTPPPPPPPFAPSGESILAAEWQFRGNTHTVSGVIPTPTPCHELVYDVIIAESYPEQVTIGFSVVPPDEGVMCAQVIDEKRFTVSFDASRDAAVRATLNGTPVALQLHE